MSRVRNSGVGLLALIAFTLTAGLAGAIPHPSLSAATSAADSAPGVPPDPFAWPPASERAQDSDGSPLLNVDPAQWLPVFDATSDLASAADEARQVARNTYTLYPLGDADRDGKGDYLLVDTAQVKGSTDRPTVTLGAISGMAGATLWTRTLPPKTFWYSAGDFDKDGIRDFVFETSKLLDQQSTPVRPPGGARAGQLNSVTEETFEAVSGATGTSPFSRVARNSFQTTYVAAGAIVGGVGLATYSVTASAMVSLGNSPTPGLDLITWQYDGGNAYAYTLAGGTYAYYQADVDRIERIDAGGGTVWSTQVGYDHLESRLSGPRDYTGDGHPDYLLFSEKNYGPNPAGNVPRQMRLTLIEGANGRAAWEYASPHYDGHAYISSLGKVRDGKDAIALSIIGFEPTPDPNQFGTRLTLLDGANGRVQLDSRTNNYYVSPLEFGDVDRDGQADVLLIRGRSEGGNLVVGTPYPRTIEYSVVRGKDLSAIWSLAPRALLGVSLSGGSTGFTDYNGDGGPDLALRTYDPKATDQSSDLRIHSGADGRALWTYHLTNQNKARQAIDDVTGDGGSDLALTIFEVPPPPPDDGTRHAIPNATEFPGFLEIRRGSDAELVWRKQIHDPLASPNVQGRAVFSSVYSVPDTNGNGVPDVIFSIRSPRALLLAITPDGQVSFVDGQTRDQSDPLNVALVAEGANGTTLRTYPAGYLPAHRPAIRGAAAPLEEPVAGVVPEGNPLPGFEWMLLAGAVAVGLLRHRSRSR